MLGSKNEEENILRKIWSCKQYREVIEDRIKATEEKGYKSKLAAAAGCKGSYLSQVLSGTIHITPEHAYRMTQFWGLTPSESEFFLLLVHHDRAGSRELRRYYSEKLRVMRQDAQDIAKSMHAESTTISHPELSVKYFAQWYPTAIHLLLGIPGFQSIEAICKRLHLSESIVRETLELLVNLNLAETRNGLWTLLKNDIHLPKDSPLAALGHSHWRYRAMGFPQGDESLQLRITSLNSVAHADIPRLREVLFEAVEKFRKIARLSAEEELVCMNLDFFRI